jgi:hypothetical protein
MTSTVRPKGKFARKARHTLEQYAIIVVYLYICFGAIVLLKVSVLNDAGIGYAPWGFAVIKALLLGKFILIGNELRLGERFTARPLIYPTLYRSLVFLVFLFVLMAIEEAVVGALHGKTIAQSLAEVVGNKFFELLASTFLMYLVLLPYFAIRQLAGVLGTGTLARLFFLNSSWPDAATRDFGPQVHRQQDDP